MDIMFKDLPILGTIELVEMSVYYDGPWLFFCKDKSENRYLAMWSMDKENCAAWLLLPLTKNLENKLVNGKLTIRQAFTEEKPEVVFRVFTNSDDGTWHVTPISWNMIPEEELPEEGGYINDL